MSGRPNRQDGTLSALNAGIEAMNLAKEISAIPVIKAVFGTVGFVLTTIRVPLLPFCYNPFHVHAYLGLDGQPTGLR